MDNQLSTAALAIVAASGGIGALIAGLLAAWVNLMLASRGEEREHETWLREKKWDVLEALLQGFADLESIFLVRPEGWSSEDERINRGLAATRQINEQRQLLALVVSPDAFQANSKLVTDVLAASNPCIKEPRTQPHQDNYFAVKSRLQTWARQALSED